MKNFISTLFLLLVFLFLIPVTMDAESKLISIKGFNYGDSEQKILDDKHFTTEFKISDYSVSEGNLELTGSFSDNEQEHQFSSTGKITESVTSIYNDNDGSNVTVDFEDNSNISVLSFTIEEKAIKNMLMPVNEPLNNHTVIKIAVKLGDSNKIFYFEDELKNLDFYNELLKNANDLSSEIQTLSNKEDLDDKEIKLLEALQEERETIASNELWFTYITKDIEKEVIEVEEGEEDLLNEEISSFSASDIVTDLYPIPNIWKTEFQNLRTVINTSSSSYGYYKDAEELTVGSGDIMTRVIRWMWVGNTADINLSNSNVSTGRTATLDITHSAKYLYREEDDTLILLDDKNSDFYLKDAKVTVSLSSNVGILNDIRTYSYLNGGDVEVDTGALVGLLPLTKWFSTVKSIYDAIDLKPEPIRNDYSWHDTIEENEAALGDIPRVFEVNIDGEMKHPSDVLGLDYKVISPTDMESNRTGYKSVRFRYQFDVKEKVTTVTERLLTEVDKELSKGFRVRENE
ncbi:hypothetical protein ACTHQ4_16525 [Alkalicoccobacillus gibsonii]|uniref:hypothetical protein n=1 Tax=Alkalicoccobacillus gibsonii TaxID=79881 RepID=UPI003F7CD017